MLRPSVLGFGLLASSLFLSHVEAAPRVSGSPPARSADAAQPAAAKVTTAKLTTTSARSLGTRHGDAPDALASSSTSVTLTPKQETALSRMRGSKPLGKLLGLLGAHGAAVTKGDPATTLDPYFGARYGLPADAQTFVDGVHYSDVEQGFVADCYFIASLSAIAYSHPELITKNLTENADGTLSLRMYHRNRAGTFVEDTVNVTKEVPLGWTGGSDRGGILYAHARDPRQMWPSYYQKAFVARTVAISHKPNSYQSIAYGAGAYALETLTGKEAQVYDINASTGDQVFTVMQHAIEAKHPVVGGTSPDIPVGTVLPNHEYTVLGVSQHDGQKFIQLRNPYGRDPGVDGVFELDLPTFNKTFVDVEVGG